MLLHLLPDIPLWTVLLGDKGIAVKIRSNSHCRNSCENKSSRNAYRSVTRKSLLGNGEMCGIGIAGYRFFTAPQEGCFYFILL
jgi:hypothetical protein